MDDSELAQYLEKYCPRYFLNPDVFDSVFAFSNQPRIYDIGSIDENITDLSSFNTDIESED